VKRVAGVLVALSLLLAGCSGSSTPPKQSPSELGGGAQPGGPNGGFNGVGLDPAQPRPSFTLTDMSGAKFSFSTATHGRPTLLYFGYTNCPDVCPTTMYDIGAALRTLPAAVQKQTYVVFVTTDVKRDTGAVLKTWLGNFTGGTQATWVGLRGTQAQIDAAQTAAHIQVAEDDGQTHSAVVLLYGSDDYARVTFPQSQTQQVAIAHDLRLVASS
jgi:protein SCO1/2